jgi:hypothetical protein
MGDLSSDILASRSIATGTDNSDIGSGFLIQPADQWFSFYEATARQI